ncbi:hypothetical protein STCU_07820 [Strigomonas culicis]|uniref:Uncharacterized protein n=1 Tax=Strigomonas culicis TaxID=28005 RepID=S9V8B0_9TRYP|nr:hypothetical protein STCU_07820 [Strigomonas culicis]|eukprot:EPY23206.1 hypothetical protein STCU_07820 [Strigomonas culicis]
MATVSKKAAGPRDTIQLAFKDSQYATPYTDHSIPGDHPMKLPQHEHLGRDHAPAPVTASHMYNNMEVMSKEVLQQQQQPSGTRVRAAGNASEATAPSYGCGYILNTNHNGRRHYDEERGTEEPWVGAGWVPHKAYAPPPPLQQETTRHAPRKGRGVYGEAGRTPAEVAAREAAAHQRDRDFLGGRRCYVPPPPGHSHIELGLWHLSGRVPAAPPAMEGESAPVVDKAVDAVKPATPVMDKPQEALAATTPTPQPSSGAGGSLPAYVASVRPEMGDIGYGSLYNQQYDFKYSVQARREKGSQREMREEIQMVHDLPPW